MKKYKMTVTNDNRWELTREEMLHLTKILGAKDISAAIGMAPAGNALFTSEEICLEYKNLDKVLLPELYLEVMTDNFSDPGLVFAKDPSMFVQGLHKSSGDFIDARVILFEISEKGESWSLNMHLESSFYQWANEGVVYDDGADNSTEVVDQIYESKNMANFGFNDLDLENDEPLSHGWETEEASS